MTCTDSGAISAKTPCGLLLCLIGIISAADNPLEAENAYIELATEIAEAMPSQKRSIAKISHHVIFCEYARAAELCQDLIAYEADLLMHARARAN